MATKTVEEKVTNTGAIILVKDPKEPDTYHVEESRGDRAWDEGTIFYPAKEIGGYLKSVEGHYFVVKHQISGNGDSSESIVGIAHTEEALKDKVYDCAKRYCEKFAKLLKKSFIDQTDDPIVPQNLEDLEDPGESQTLFLNNHNL